MSVECGPRCYNCNRQMTCQGETSLLGKTIYRCSLCKMEVWQADKPPVALAEIKEPQAA